jgi:hypothetical protein
LQQFTTDQFTVSEKLELKESDIKDKKKESKIDEKMEIKGGNTKGKNPYEDADQRFMEGKIHLIDEDSSNLLALLTETATQNRGQSQGQNGKNYQGQDQVQNGNTYQNQNIFAYDDRPKKNPKIPESKKLP